MVRVWDAFNALGLWALLLVPVVAFAVAYLAGALRPRWPRFVTGLAAALVFPALTLALLMTMSPGSESATRLPPAWNPWPLLSKVLAGNASLRAETLGNLLLLLPLGAALALLLRPSRAGLLVVAVALSLETTQWLLATGRQAETLDVLLNSAGGLAGIGLAVWAQRLAGAPPDEWA